MGGRFCGRPLETSRSQTGQVDGATNAPPAGARQASFHRGNRLCPEPDQSVATCPLCAAPGASAYHRDRVRRYYRCRRCALVFVAPDAWVDRATEKARYDQHQNDPSDPRYRRFLSRLTDPLLAKLTPGTVGLDFGSGPGPALPQMLEAAGLRVCLYDPFYAPDNSVWTRQYGFIAASEVVEHLREPAAEFDRLFAALEPGGWLGVMTKWVEDRDRFAGWRYIRDQTHIAFFCPETLRWVSYHWGMPVEFPAVDVALFRKPG